MTEATRIGALQATGRIVASPIRAIASLGMTGIATIQSILFCAWAYYYFWVVAARTGDPKVWLGFFTPERVPANMAWLAIGYLSIGTLSHVITNYERGWKLSTPMFNIGSSIIAAVVMVIAFYDYSFTMATPARFEVGLQCLTLTVVESVVGGITAFALARRQVNLGSGGMDA